jgi:hypothetical protein
VLPHGVGVGEQHSRRPTGGLGDQSTEVQGSKRREQRRVEGGGDTAADTDLAAKVGLRRREVGLRPEEGELGAAELYPAAQRIGAGRGAGAQLVDRNGELLFRTLDAPLGDANELLGRECGKERLLRHQRCQILFVGERCVGCGHVGSGGVSLIEAAEPLEQIEAQANPARVAGAAWRRDDLPGCRVETIRGRIRGRCAEGERGQKRACVCPQGGVS